MDDWLKNPLVRRLLPPVTAVLLFSAFVWLGFWQLDRADQKEKLLARFADGGTYRQTTAFANLEEFERIAVTGRYDQDRQILIDNIARNGRIGYYVVTPFRLSRGGSLLLVNRGWLAKTGIDAPIPELAVGEEHREIRGLAGHLPRVGFRPGEGFAGQGAWPRIGVYPTLDEVAQELGEPVQPVVLLLMDDTDPRLVQRWEPNVSGPMTHYGYAFQWFLMAAAVAALTAWHTRKGRRRG